MSSVSRASYDHQLRDAIVATGDVHLFPDLVIPASTRRTWLSRGTTATFDLLDFPDCNCVSQQNPGHRLLAQYHAASSWSSTASRGQTPHRASWLASTRLFRAATLASLS